jgi:hypothetical protein
MDLKEILFIVAVKLSKEISGIYYDEEQTLKIAEAAFQVTQDPAELETMMKIAKWESGFRKDISDCIVKGDGGRALGPWQVRFRGDSEKELLCQDYVSSAKIALDRIRESYVWCSKFGFHGSDLLSGYTIGKCKRNTISAKRRYGAGKMFEGLN